ncbi:hypothetical protein PMIN01_05635 [Paraphaeosphaeria minitans]|uniref:Uncharacterized protein n=1 Tax=Paraphaeosphaeria minitans TaxID=565426 RepID=A0A9P6GIQ7_9PLEO|nr:hypothetical protein PMIN01_05635 [Paraphaeosphaeria minitans]
MPTGKAASAEGEESGDQVEEACWPYLSLPIYPSAWDVSVPHESVCGGDQKDCVSLGRRKARGEGAPGRATLAGVGEGGKWKVRSAKCEERRLTCGRRMQDGNAAEGSNGVEGRSRGPGEPARFRHASPWVLFFFLFLSSPLHHVYGAMRGMESRVAGFRVFFSDDWKTAGLAQTNQGVGMSQEGPARASV